MLRRSLIAGAGATAFVARRAVALTAAQRLLLYSTPPWVLAGASLDFDFENNRYYQQGRSNSIDSLITCSRASTGYVDDVLNTWSSIGANLPRIGRGKGLLDEEVRTNLALWCRDFTNAVWVKTTLTAALTATGIDGIANSASTLTATGAAATALQTVVQLSTADTVSFFVKQVSGSGTVSITGDGISYTDITASLSTTNWFRATVSATLINPVIGIKLATSGNVIAVDFAQLEAGAFATSPILTTTVAVTRATDIATVTNPPVFGTELSLYLAFTPMAPLGYTTNQSLIQVDDGTPNHRVQIARSGVVNSPAGLTVTQAGQDSINTGTWAANTIGKAAVGARDVDQAISFNGANVATLSHIYPVGLSIVRIGANSAGSVIANGVFQRIALWPIRLSNADLQRITA